MLYCGIEENDSVKDKGRVTFALMPFVGGRNQAALAQPLLASEVGGVVTPGWGAAARYYPERTHNTSDTMMATMIWH